MLNGQLAKSSGLLASSGSDQVVLAAPGVYCGATLVGGSDASSLVIYDNASASSGTKLDQLSIIGQTTAGDDSVFHDHRNDVAKLGITVVVTGTGATAVVWYKPL